MRVVLWLVTILGCGLAGPGELWLRIDSRDPDGDRVTLTLPATTLLDAGDPALLETVDGPVDLRPEAHDLGTGDARTWTLRGDRGTATLSRVAVAEGAASEVSVGIRGKQGRTGLSVAIPLEPADIERARQKARVDLDLDLPVDIDAAACAQWRRSPPTPILEIVGPKGNGLTVTTR